MRISQRFKSILTSKRSHAWKISLSTGIFLFFVLYFYNAYSIQTGESYAGYSLLFRSLLFALATSLIFALHEFWIIPKANYKHKYSRLLWYLWEVFLGLNITFVLFNIFWNWTELYWSSYSLFLFEYPLIVIIPILFFTNWKTKTTTIDMEIETALELLDFISENGKHKIQIQPSQLLFIKSADNYVEIFYLSDNKVKKELQRNSLKRIEATKAGEILIRCHRSYIVNPKNVIKIVSSPRQIELDYGNGNIVPVSKSYQNNFR